MVIPGTAGAIQEAELSIVYTMYMYIHPQPRSGLINFVNCPPLIIIYQLSITRQPFSKTEINTLSLIEVYLHTILSLLWLRKFNVNCIHVKLSQRTSLYLITCQCSPPQKYVCVFLSRCWYVEGRYSRIGKERTWTNKKRGICNLPNVLMYLFQTQLKPSL